MPRYSTITDYVRLDLFAELAKRGLFEVGGRLTTQPVPYEQTVDDYLEFFHSMSGFSRERMGAENTARFDEEVQRFVAPYVRDGVLRYDVTVDVAWGLPPEPGGC